MNAAMAKAAKLHKIPLVDVIDPVALAVRLAGAGMPVAQAAALCGVNRATLHRRIAEKKLKV